MKIGANGVVMVHAQILAGLGYKEESAPATRTTLMDQTALAYMKKLEPVIQVNAQVRSIVLYIIYIYNRFHNEKFTASTRTTIMTGSSKYNAKFPTNSAHTVPSHFSSSFPILLVIVT